MVNLRFSVRLPKSFFRKLKNYAISSPAKTESTVTPELAEKFKSQDAQHVDVSEKRKKRLKLQRKFKTKASVKSVLAADCGCRSRPYLVVHQIPVTNKLPEICLAPSLPRSSVEIVDEFSDLSSGYTTVTSFDEMLKRPSNFHVDQVQSESGHQSSNLKDNNSLELQIPRINFNDLVTQLWRNERLTMTDDTNGHKFVKVISSPKLNSTRQTAFSSEPTTPAKKKVQYTAKRRSVSNNRGLQFTDSLAIMKPSSDPKSEFRESMMVMIAENKIKAAKDLEELLVCYLLLNSADYHDVIVQVFKQIWTELIKNQRM